MADSSTYTPETLARRYAMAQQLLADPKQPVKNWAQGLDELAKGALGGYQINQTENLERQSRGDANAQIAAALGLPAPPPVKDNPSGFEKIANLFRSSPSDATPSDATPQSPAPNPPIDVPGQQSMVSPQPVSGGNQPASIRFNNPGAQWPGPSADKFGSTGSGVIGGGNKIAAFDNPVSGAAAQFDLLGRKYAGKPLSQAIADWSGNNNAPQYTAAVSQATGIPPDATITPDMLRNPQFAIPLAKAMAKQETGRDYPLSDAQWGQAHAMAFNGAPAQGNPLANAPVVNGNGPSPLDNAQWPAGPIGAPSTNSPPQGGSATPNNVPPNAQQARPIQSGPDILGGQQSPPVGPTGAAPAGLAGNPNAGKIAALLTNPWIDPSVKTQVLTQLNPTYGFQTLPDGTILRTNPKTGTVEPIYSAPVKPELKETGTDPLTQQKSFGVFDPKTQTMRPVSAPDGTSPSPQNSLLAPGVTAVDHSLSGDNYLNQFGPEVKAAVKSYIDGDVMPSGNPRKDTIANQAKLIAQKYGQDMGIPVSDSTYASKRQLKTDLARSTPGSLGGQQKFAGTALEHLAEVADGASQLDNSSGPLPGWLPGSSTLAHGINEVGATSTDQSPKINRVNGAVQHYGQEITKFYTGSPGGESERMRFMQTMDPTKLTGPEMASAIRTERDLIPGRLKQNAAQIQTVLGPQEAEKYSTLPAEYQQSIDRINKGLAKLDPNGPEAKGSTQSNAAPSAPMEKTINGKTYYKFGPNPTDWAEK